MIEIFAQINAILSESDIDDMCNAQLYGGRLSEEDGEQGASALPLVGAGGLSFFNSALPRHQDALREKGFLPAPIRGVAIFRADIWPGWVLYPEFELMGRGREYDQRLSEIREKSADLWKVYLQFRKSVRDVLVA